MTSLPDVQKLYEVTEQTWPPAVRHVTEGWTIRDGQGGGKRVSAATILDAASDAIVTEAENEMLALEQRPLFMIREGEETLDARLDARAYRVIDHVNLYACRLDALTDEVPPLVTASDIWPPLAIQTEIWKGGGIGPERVNVMHSACTPKPALFGRANGRAAATGFVAVHDRIAMIHALEVLEGQRRAGMGRHLTRHAAHWAQAQGALYMAVLCTTANEPANALYSSLGMTVVGQYHYRIKEG